MPKKLVARTPRAQWKAGGSFRPTVVPPERLRRRVMEPDAKCDPVAYRQRAVFAENLCRQLEGHLLKLIAENDWLEVKLKQSRKTLRQLRQSIRGQRLSHEYSIPGQKNDPRTAYKRKSPQLST
jgi:hypothetical protein